MNKERADKTLIVLEAMREARASLVERSLCEDPDLYKSLFLFEKNNNMLKLFFEKEFNLWIDSHWEIADSLGIENDDEGLNIFQDSVFMMVDDRYNFTSKDIDFDGKELCLKILAEKIKIIQETFYFSEKNEKNIKKLKYFYEKNKALFEREFQDIMESNR